MSRKPQNPPSWLHLVGILLGGWLMAAGSTPAATGIPDLLFHDAYPGYPIWVSAESALTLDGQPDEDLFTATQRSSISRLRDSAKESECVQLMAPIDESMTINGAADPRANLSSALRTADWVFLGKVIDRSSGFRGGQAGTLMEIKTIESLRGTDPGFESYFIYHPATRFFLGSTEICKEAWQYAELPALGGEILVLVNLSEPNSGRLLWVGESSGMITFRSEGDVSLPAVYLDSDAGLGGSKKNEFLRWVRSALHATIEESER